MNAHAETVATVVGCATGLAALGGIAVRVIIKPLRRIADRVEYAAEVVEGAPERKMPNGYVIEPAKPGVAEQFQRHGEALNRVESGVAGLYPRVDALERTVVEKRLPGTA